MKFLVQLVNQRNTRGDIHIDDVGIGNMVEIFDERTEAVPVACDQDVLAGFYSRGDLFVPAREEPRHRILQTFRGGKLLLAEIPIARIVARMPWVFRFEGGRADIVTAPPQLDLRLPIFPGRLGLV